MVRRALSLLGDIARTEPASSSPVLEASSRRVIDGLQDLVALEGIYPFLLPGVGIPLEQRIKSLLPASVTATPAEDAVSSISENELLQDSVDALYEIVMKGPYYLQTIIRSRSLVDVIAGCGQLAFRPENQIEKYKTLFQRVLQEYVLFILLSIYATAKVRIKSDARLLHSYPF